MTVFMMQRWYLDDLENTTLFATKRAATKDVMMQKYEIEVMTRDYCLQWGHKTSGDNLFGYTWFIKEVKVYD